MTGKVWHTFFFQYYKLCRRKVKPNGRAYFDCSFPGCRAGLKADYTDKESSNSEEPVPDLATLDPPEAHVGRDGLQHPVQVGGGIYIS